MQNITTTLELKNAIQLLEMEHALIGLQLKEKFEITVESLKPINLLKGTFGDIVTSPNLIENLISTVLGLATGYLSKKIVVGASSGIIRTLLGSILQSSVSSYVSQHPDGVKSLGQFIFQQIFRKKEAVPS